MLLSLTIQSWPWFLVLFHGPSGSVNNRAIMYHGELSAGATYVTLPYSLQPGAWRHTNERVLFSGDPKTPGGRIKHVD